MSNGMILLQPYLGLPDFIPISQKGGEWEMEADEHSQLE
jgi:hypothetical protein